MKTRIALKCLKSFIDHYPATQFIVVVPTTTLKDQWEQQLNDWDLHGTVLVLNTAATHKYKTDILVLDECHRTNSLLFKEIFSNIQYRFVLGLTATYERLDDRQKLVMDKFCPVVDRITLQEALLNGWIAKYKEYQVLIDVDDLDKLNALNKEFTMHFEFFNYDFNRALSLLGPKGFQERIKLAKEMSNSSNYKEMLKAVTYHAQRFMQVLQARKKFINNHPKKIEIARKIIAARPYSKIITFSNNVKMAEAIGIGDIYTGKDSKTKSRITIEDFNAKTGFAVLNTIKKANEGLDVKGLSVAIVLGLDSSEIQAVQRRGRVVRKENDKVAEIFNLIIKNSVEAKWFSTSHKRDPYITIDEQGLNDVLNGKEPQPYVKKVKDFNFRF